MEYFNILDVCNSLNPYFPNDRRLHVTKQV